MTGIMSLLPDLMGVPMEEIRRDNEIGTRVREALESQSGDLGTMLQLNEALDSANGETCQMITRGSAAKPRHSNLALELLFPHPVP